MSARDVTDLLGGLKVRGLVVREGVSIPPAAGPYRDEVLRSEGAACLKVAKQKYGQAVLAISPFVPGELAAFPAAGPRPREVVRRDQQRWRAIRDCVRRGVPVGRGSGLPGEAEARAALRKAVDAFNFLDELGTADLAHDWLHRAGALVGGIYGCELRLEDGVWWDTCAVWLAHLRLGWSPGFRARRNCTVCGEDLSGCKHLPNESYPIVAEQRDGYCTVCWSHCCEDHVVGNTYSVRAGGLISEAEIIEVSAVPRPRDPLARLHAVEIPTSALRSRLGPIPNGANSLWCMRCVDPCAGFVRPWEN